MTASRGRLSVNMPEHNLQSPPDAHSEAVPCEVLLVRLERELYALPSASVREVVRLRPITPVPGAPPALPGIISQRGAILPVVELRSLLGLPEAELSRAARLVVVHHNDVDMALIVEEVLDLADLPAHSIEPVPSALPPTRARLLSNIAQYADQPVALLDLDALIAVLREEK